MIQQKSDHRVDTQKECPHHLLHQKLDKKTSETFYSVEAKTRLKENFLLSLELKVATNSELGEPNFPQSRDDYLELQINHFF